MKFFKLNKIEAVVLTAFLMGAIFLAPANALTIQTKNVENNFVGTAKNFNYRVSEITSELSAFKLDRTYVMEPTFPLSLVDNDDAGYKKDAGNDIARGTIIYPGEMIDDWPGRSRTGKIGGSDVQDWYAFAVCEGQSIALTMTPPSGYNYDLYLWDDTPAERASSTNSDSTPETITFVADSTGPWYMEIKYISGSGAAQYSFTIDLNGQNDANTGNDAGDNFADATLLTAGSYNGYLDMNDEEDWYKFNVNSGQGIHFVLSMKSIAYFSDFDISLYNPSGEMVYREAYYYDDDLLYPADVSGLWRIKINIFPGYTDIPNPIDWDYWTYGSGPYQLDFSIESSAPSPPGPIPQPEITPIAHTFKVANDPDSNNDEYGYLASIPACNYIEGGDRYLAPIIYTGDDTPTNWDGVVDDTTDYLVDDWNTYLSIMGKTAIEYNVPADPIQAAAQIATDNWVSSDLAVVAVDGSDYKDTTSQVLKKTRTITRKTEVETIPNDSNKIIQISGAYVYPMTLGPKWGAINVSIEGAVTTPYLTEIFPKFMSLVNDWWPEHQEKNDMYYPITTAGIWAAGAASITGDWDLKITKYECDRYRIKISNADSVITAKVTTTTPSDLLVFLVDPEGHIRAPDVPDWNGGEINPIHVWNGIDDEDLGISCDPFRSWNPEPHTEFSAEVLHPEKGYWTVIVVPRYAQGSASIKYTVTAEVRTINPKRSNAAISAANAAVIASQEHVPLLYVKENEIPTETQNAFNTLGVDNVIFVERGEIGSGVRDDLPTIQADLKTMQQIIDHIKDYPQSENYITITSLKTGDGGFFAPSAMLAAYHASPVLRIEEASTEVAGGSGVGAIIIGQINGNAYAVDAQTGEMLWSYPNGWTPQEPLNSNMQNSENIYLGSTQDMIFCIEETSGDIIWNYPAETMETTSITEGSLYLDVTNNEAFCLDAISGEVHEFLPIKSVVNPAGMANRIDTWELWGGDYYHGNRAPGHLPIHTEPVDQIGPGKLLLELIKYILSSGEQGEIPPLGMDAKRYWNEEMYNGVHDWIEELGLDLDGQEGYAIVAPRKDIRLQLHSVMMGNKSYAGHIPGTTVALSADLVARTILYPALIYANPNRDVTTTQFMNYPDGGTWKTNDGKTYQVYSSREVKKSFMSHNRIFDGHCLWDAHLERINDGASVMYYSGHGTGGSGISGQYMQSEHSNYPDQIWYDAWRGYMYDNWKTPRENGQRWYNPEPPNLYDIIHYKYVDQLMENLKSLAVFYMSCSTAQQFAPLVYLEHGAVTWYGNAGSGLCPEADLQDDEFFKDTMINGMAVGPAFSKQVWLHYRDFTTSDPTSMYGPSSLYGGDGVTTIQCIYGDPELIIYSPEWTSPTPVNSPLGSRNEPPSAPIITGPTSGNAGTTYDYTFVSTDPEGDDLEYYIKWCQSCGGGEWFGPFPSGQEVTVNHSWSEQGMHTISAMAKDTYGDESDWSYLEVTMPLNLISIKSNMLVLKMLKQNTNN